MATKYTKIWVQNDKEENGGHWETIATLPSSTKGIQTENPDFLEDDETSVDADTALSRLEDRVEELQRSVSWLSRYGIGSGGGGGNSSGSTGTATFVVTNYTVLNNTIYVTDNKASITFYISSSRNNTQYSLNALYNSNYLLKDKEVYSGQNGAITVDIDLTNTTNTLILQAEDENGYSTDPYTLSIVRSDVTLSWVIPEGQGNARSDMSSYNIRYTVTTQASAEITIEVSTRGKKSYITVPAQTGSMIGRPQIGLFDLFKAHEFNDNQEDTGNLFITTNEKIAGGTYNIQAIATANINAGGNIITAKSGTKSLLVTISTGNSIAVAVNNITDRNAAETNDEKYYVLNGTWQKADKPNDLTKVVYTVYSEEALNSLNTSNYKGGDYICFKSIETNKITQITGGSSISFNFTPVINNANTLYYAYYIEPEVGNASDLSSDVINTENTRFSKFWIFDNTVSDGIDHGKLGDIQSGRAVIQGTTEQIKIDTPSSIGKHTGLWNVTLIVATTSGTYTIKHLVCNLLAPSNYLLEDPNPDNKRVAWWGVGSDKKFPESTDTVWTRTENWTDNNGQAATSELSLKLYNSNGSKSGFLRPSGQQDVIRLSGEAYGVINANPFSVNTAEFWAGDSSVKHGFTISVTFKTDIHPYNDRTVFMCGDFIEKTDSKGVKTGEYEFNRGIRVTLEQAMWKFYDGDSQDMASCNIQQGNINTVDFVYDPSKELILIYVNGVINAARTCANFSYDKNNLASNIYLAADGINASSGTIIRNYADVNFYDIQLFRSAFSDKDAVVNYINSKARASLIAAQGQDTPSSINFDDYNKWRSRNFFKSSKDTSGNDVWTCSLWDDINNTYSVPDFSSLTTSKPPLPVVFLDFYGQNGGTKFTKSAYETIGVSTDIDYSGGTFHYYDPSTDKQVDLNGALTVQFQGTSSVNYRSKNLEIIFDGYVTKVNSESGVTEEDKSKPLLFQPREDWFPEHQFTLKADVVDSSHANNTAIGRWINRHGDEIFNPTPPMTVYKETDVHIRDAARYNANTKSYSYEAKNDDGSIKYHDKTKETFKYTLEGFPIILLVRFAPENENDKGSVVNLGIYSFNLGRHSDFNMGFRFFKSFTTRTLSDEQSFQAGSKLPAFVTDYEVTNVFGNNDDTKIDAKNIYSYEISVDDNATYDDSGTLISPAIFSQDDISVIKHAGSFRYSGDSSTSGIADNYLKLLFTATSTLAPENTPKFIWDTDTNSYKKTSEQYAAKGGPQDWEPDSISLNNILDIRSAYTYFMVTVAFGLVDSLGKNMTLRCWNVKDSKSLTDLGETSARDKWYCCFYDMDTAFGLSNIGTEDIKKYVYIDEYSNDSNGKLQIKRNTQSYGGGFDTYSNRLWEILRNANFLKVSSMASYDDYEELWAGWRNGDLTISETNENGGTVSIDGFDADNFIEYYFIGQTRDVGELLYDADYREKYLTKFINSIKDKDGNYVDKNASSTYANINFLHGNRIEYARDWFKKRIYFLDGVFNLSNNNLGSKSPYLQKFGFSCGGNGTNETVLTVRSACPIILTVNIGGNTGSPDAEFFLDENTDLTITLPGITSNNKQITINDTSEITKLDGLKNIQFQAFTTHDMPLSALSEIDLSNVTTLTDNPIDFSLFISNNDSNIRKINLSGTKFNSATANSQFAVNVSKFSKLKEIDISNSCVTSLVLPSSNMSKCNITNSSIKSISFTDQALLDKLDFTGCNNLTNVAITNCSKITNITLNNLANLQSLTIQDCDKVSSISCKNNKKLTNFAILGSHNTSVTSIDISGCENNNLASSASTNGGSSMIDLQSVPNLKILNMANTQTDLPIYFSSDILKSNIPGTFNFNFNNSCVKDIRIGGTDPQRTFKRGDTTYTILDFSRFPKNIVLNLHSLLKAEAIKFWNDKDAYTITASMFTNGGNTLNNSLRRVFGHLKLTSCSFLNCKLFKIREDLDPVVLKVDDNTSMNITRNIHSYTEKYYDDTDKLDWENAGTSTTNAKLLETNIEFTGSNISRCFEYSSCSIDDVYYAFSKITSSVTNIGSLFAGCSAQNRSGIDFLKRNLFENCSSVTYAGSVFGGAGGSGSEIDTRLDGYLYSPAIVNGNMKPGLFSYLPNLSGNGADSMFYGGPNDYIGVHFFHRLSSNSLAPMNITSLSNFSGWYGGSFGGFVSEDFVKASHILFDNYLSQDMSNISEIDISSDDYSKFATLLKNSYITGGRSEDYVDSGEIFKYLSNLQTINGMFNNVNIHFNITTENSTTDTTKYYYCPIFKGLTKLVWMDTCFKNTNAEGVLLNIFGGGSTGDSKYNNIFPTNLSYIRNSFIFNGDDSTKAVVFPLSDNTLERLPNLIGFYNEQSHTTEYELGYGVFQGNIVRVYKKGEFPYYIFKNNPNLVEMPGFMVNIRPVSEIKNYGGNTSDYIYLRSGDYDDVTLPCDSTGRSMFAGLTKLTVLARFFEITRANSTFRYTLTSDGFDDCSNLTNISYIFAEYPKGMGSYTEGSKHGGIPYKLFYSEKTTTSYVRGWTVNEAKSTFGSEDATLSFGLKDKGFIQVIDLTSTQENSATDLGSVDISTVDVSGYSEKDSSGNTIYYKTTDSSTGESTYYKIGLYCMSDSELDTTQKNSYNNPTNNSITIESWNNKINNMKYALRSWTSKLFTPYVSNIDTSDIDKNIGGLIIQNPKYNPVKYIKNNNFSRLKTITVQTAAGEKSYRIQNSNTGALKRIILNPNYDQYKYIWNYRYLDGTLDTYNKMKTINDDIKAGKSTTVTADNIPLIDTDYYNANIKSLVYSSYFDNSGSKSYNQVSTINPADKSDTDSDIFQGALKAGTENRLARFNNTNSYFCPSDIFSYCNNVITTNVSGVFSDSGMDSWQNTQNTGSYADYGIHGRICGALFRDINKVSDLSYMFYGDTNLDPYKYPVTDGEFGDMYPPDLFSGMTNLSNLKGIFAWNYIPKNVGISSSLFTEIGSKLSNASRMFENAWFFNLTTNSGNIQFPSSVFSNNRNLSDISRMFYVSDDQDKWNRAPKYINFDISKNTINNAIGFFRKNNTSRGKLPRFWAHSVETKNYRGCYTNCGITASNATDYGLSSSDVTNYPNAFKD